MPIAAAIPAVLSVGSSLYGASQQSKAAKKAAQASQAATDAAIAEQRRQYDQTRADNMPWHDAGVAALGRLNDPNASFQASPDYAFRKAQGLEAVTQNAAVNHLLNSGSVLKGLTGYGQNLASGEFNNWWSRQAGLAGAGQNANSLLANSGQNTANNIGSALTGNANNLASSYAAQAQANSNMAGSLAGGLAWGANNYFQPQSTAQSLMSQYNKGGGSNGNVAAYASLLQSFL